MPDLWLEGPAGRLAARHDPPEAPAPALGPQAALLCHPHPLHGGTLHNKVVHSLARALREAGLHVLRFDFRGAGGSAGAHDEGRGEQDDARLALERLVQLAGTRRLLVGGFSFGSWVASEATEGDPRVEALLAVAPPVNHYPFTALAAGRCPRLVLWAPDDELVPEAATRAWLARCRGAPRAVAVGGGGHLFHGRLGALRAAVAEWVSDLAAGRG